jgi:hypothetical protein
MLRRKLEKRCLSCVAAWVQVGWETLRLGSRRARWWRTRAMVALVFALIGVWAAVAPQGALSLGERLRLSFDAITMGCFFLAATAGLRRQAPILQDGNLGLHRGGIGLARWFSNATQVFQELAPAIPFFILLAALQVVSPAELVAVFVEIALAAMIASSIRNVRLTVMLIVLASVFFLTWRRNLFETLIVALLGSHVAVKAFMAWSAVDCTHRFKTNLMHELATPIDAKGLAMIYRKRAWRGNGAALMAVAFANIALVAALATGMRVPASLEQKFAICCALAAGVGVLFLDASALFWGGLVSGVATNNVHRAFSRLFGTVVGIPWAVAWAFSALHSGEAVTVNELAAYFILWTLLGGSMSWITAAKAKGRFEHDLRALVSES